MKLIEWLEESRAKINERRWAGAIYDVLLHLTQWPVISIAAVTGQYGMTPTAASNIVSHLVEISVLREITGRSYGRLFAATDVIRILDDI